MGDVIHARFGGPSEYDEALFRQALREEIRENGGSLTQLSIKTALLRTVHIATVFDIEDADALDEYIGVIHGLLEREREMYRGTWSP